MSAPPAIRVILLDSEIVVIGVRESATGAVVGHVECGYSCDLTWKSLVTTGAQTGSFEVFLRVPSTSLVDFVTFPVRLSATVSVSAQPFEAFGIALGGLRALGLEPTP